MDANFERREAELALLEAMYPDIVSWHEQRAELTYKIDNCSLVLRIPDEYPTTARPLVISASLETNKDVRDNMKQSIQHLSTPEGEECLDAIIQVFEELKNMVKSEQITFDNSHAEKDETTYRTCVVWLHHLLNTNKRKLAITPATGSTGIAGCTKPGYPGVLLYSGEASIVDRHITILHDQRWQAFQIRHDEQSSQPWSFVSSGIVEVNSMAEVVEFIADAEKKEVFLKAIGIK